MIVVNVGVSAEAPTMNCHGDGNRYSEREIEARRTVEALW